MNRLFLPQLLIVSFAIIFVFSCKKDDSNKLQILKGPEVPMGKGKASSYFSINANGIPRELGIEMTADAVTGLSNNPTDFGANTFVLPIDQKAKELTPFDHLEIGWNPQGHDPAGVFDVPHFDFHFYMITEAEQKAIPPYMPSTAALHDKLPPAGYMPASYQPTPGGVPQMGKHWGDMNMKMPFSHTMTLGSYNGKFTFLEPMVTKVFLEAGTKVSADYAQPAQFEKTGKYYPTKYNIYRDASTHKYYVTVSNFVKR